VWRKTFEREGGAAHYHQRPGRRPQRLPWSDVVGAAIDARTHPGYTACEVAGATMHDALLTVRRITAAPRPVANTSV